MHVLHAADYGNPVAGSFIPALAALARRLRDDGHTMTLVAPQIDGATWHDHVRDAGATLVLVASPQAAADAVRSMRPDVAHIHFFGYYLPVTRALHGTGTRIFWHMHSYVPNVGSLKERVKGFVRYRLLARPVERFVAVSEAIAAELRIASAPADKISVVPNGVDMERFRPPTTQERAEARAMLGIAPDQIVHLFFGRDRHIKGADTLERAIERVPGRTLLVVGATRETLERLQPHSNVVDVESVNDTRPLFWAADSIVVPSRGEGFSYALVEGLACGLPAIVSSIRPLLDVSSGVANVRVITVDNFIALASALELTTIRGGQPRAQAILRYDLGHWVTRTRALYS